MWCGAGTGSWSSRPWRSRSVLRGESATTYASSKLNRVGRRAARYDSGLSAHRCTRPARKRPAPHRIAHERVACSRSRCGNFTLPCKFFLLPPVNSCQHPSYLPLATPAPPLPHNHARYDALGTPYNAYNPTRCSPPTTNCGTESTWGYTTTAYDALGRPTSITLQDGSVVSASYSNNTVTTTDPAGKKRQTNFDALG